jgi:hypothetical protein
MTGQLPRERIRIVRLGWSRPFLTEGRRFRRPAAAEVLDQRERQPVQPRAASRKLELVGSLAQERVAEDVR